MCPSGAQVTHPWGGWGSTGCLARPGCDAAMAPLLPTPRMLGHPLQWDPQQPLVASRSTHLHSQLSSCHPHSSPELSPLCEPSSAGSKIQGQGQVWAGVLGLCRGTRTSVPSPCCNPALQHWDAGTLLRASCTPCLCCRSVPESHHPERLRALQLGSELPACEVHQHAG